MLLMRTPKLKKLFGLEWNTKNRHILCSHCKSFGHSLARCPSANFKWVPKLQVGQKELPPHVPSVKGSSSGPLPSDGWTVVAKGLKQQSNPKDIFPLQTQICSTFSPLWLLVIRIVSVTLMQLPLPTPLWGKLKLIDEKEVRDLKHKAVGSLDFGQASKKKIKGGGSKKSPT